MQQHWALRAAVGARRHLVGVALTTRDGGMPHAVRDLLR